MATGGGGEGHGGGGGGWGEGGGGEGEGGGERVVEEMHDPRLLECGHALPKDTMLVSTEPKVCGFMQLNLLLEPHELTT